MWQRVLDRRRRQIRNLSPAYFRLFVNDLSQDLRDSRMKVVDSSDGSNEHEGHFMPCSQPNISYHPKQNRAIDLATGHYSSLLITEHPPPLDLTYQSVILHLVALFYRSLDERLSWNEREHGLDAVQRAFTFLDERLKHQTVNPEGTRNGVRSGEKRDDRTEYGEVGVDDEGPKDKRSTRESKSPSSRSRKVCFDIIINDRFVVSTENSDAGNDIMPKKRQSGRWS